jgi:hypothetical protein
VRYSLERLHRDDVHSLAQWRHEETEGEGDEKSEKTARHGSLLHARTCGGILRGMCRGRKAHFAD